MRLTRPRDPQRELVPGADIGCPFLVELDVGARHREKPL
ncbi:MAG: hypothetical protein AVDCRST_MAG14-1363 [uncultured Rubrobacteraceae bacterium]|uniref:Uncharacterized protein n=1 Tax=uncultured Rubrobacteraceae bacterium TaxID=349277 RepID=A0A6J4QT28_9ACTN|nr:MAG: hypothetical protein AVDCRST_MAG14-1363 [uncultured Rubrobacteraceae bacterium]